MNRFALEQNHFQGPVWSILGDSRVKTESNIILWHDFVFVTEE